MKDMDDRDLRARLSPEAYRVLREGATEAPFSGKYVHPGATGTFVCAACGAPLFSSGTQFDSGSGWPSFDAAIPGAVLTRPDTSLGMERTELTCARCGSHLGHLFDDGPTPTGKRFCVNSVSLDLDAK